MICAGYTEPLYFFFVSDLPGIIYYSHIPAIIVPLLVGIFVFLNDRKALLNQLLFGICACFSLWIFFDLITWTNIHSNFILFSWSFFGPLQALIAVLSVYFMYVFLTKKDVGTILKLIFLILAGIAIVLAPTELSLRGFNISSCDAFGLENQNFQAYYSSLGALAMLWILGLLVWHYRKAVPAVKKQIVLMGMGIELFLFSFFTVEFLGAYLTTIGVLPDSQLETYGYFGMIVFMVFIGIFLVRFKTFHASLIAAQALVIALVILIASEFTFTRNATNLTLIGITLVLTVIIGFVLIRSTKREIAQREHIEQLAKELEKANQQQVSLIHFITHQLKGFVTKSRNIFSMLNDGDYGAAPDTMKPLIQEGFDSATKGAQTIQEILNAANIKSGKVEYAKAPFSFKNLVEGIVQNLKPNADSKGVALTLSVPDADVTLVGDQMQMENAIKNLVDNAVKYTPQGSIAAALTDDGTTIRFTTKDTGVGITSEDMQRLFTEGGHGAESTKVNVDSTGFGLYIVKNIIEAHGGTVRAESEGKDKGSTFIVELPAGGK